MTPTELARARALCDAATPLAIETLADAARSALHQHRFPSNVRRILTDALAAFDANSSDLYSLRSMRAAVYRKDVSDGCCGPGNWCCFKPYSEIAVHCGQAIAELAQARAALAERDAALERIAERGCIYAESDLTCREREWPEDEWCASCIASNACIAAAPLASRAGDGEQG